MTDFIKNQNPQHISETTYRVFFALWPTDSTRKQLVEAFAQSSIEQKQGRVVTADNLHITLHFIGHVNQQQLQCLHRAAQTVTAGSFELELDHYGYFEKPKVLFMGLKHTPLKLTYLHKVLGEALAVCNYQTEPRPYAPHVTLMRKLKKLESFENSQAVHWQAKEFVLVKSVSIEGGVRYEVIEHYDLQ